MNIFEDIGTKLYEKGLSVMPIKKNDKAACIDGWDRWCAFLPSKEEFDSMIATHKDYGIGLCLGSSSTLMAVDFDYTGPDAEKYEKMVRDALPFSPVEKRGHPKKFTLFYRYNPDIRIRHFQNFIDVLSAGSYTVLPPSIHPITKEPFFYSNGDLQSIEVTQFKQLSLVDIGKLEQIYLLAKSEHPEFFVKENGKGRNNKLKKIVVAMKSKGKSEDEIIDEVFGEDLKNNPPLFSDEKEKNFGDPLENCKRFVQSILKSIDGIDLKNPDEGEEKSKRKKDYYRYFEDFFKKKFPNIIHEKLSDEYKILDHKDGSWVALFNSLKWIKSEAHEYGLNHAFTEIHISKYIETLKPRLLYIPDKWDGISRFEKIFDCLEFSREGISKNVAIDLFKWWLACIPGRIENPLNQNKIIVLRGPQNIGKDTFCNKVFGTTFRSYYVNIEPTENNKDNFQTIHGKLVANISEFDQTNRMSVSAIKNLITANSMRMRLPYAPAPEDLKFHTSFIASSNFENILRDTSGNRRFMIFDIEKIKFEYDEFLDGEQLLAEIYHLHASKYVASDMSQQILEKFIESETPDNSDDIIIDAATQIIGASEATRHAPLRYCDIAEEIQKLGRVHGVSVFRIQQIMKSAGLQYRTNSARYYSVRRKEDTQS